MCCTQCCSLGISLRCCFVTSAHRTQFEHVLPHLVCFLGSLAWRPLSWWLDLQTPTMYSKMNMYINRIMWSANPYFHTRRAESGGAMLVCALTETQHNSGQLGEIVPVIALKKTAFTCKGDPPPSDNYLRKTDLKLRNDKMNRLLKQEAWLVGRLIPTHRCILCQLFKDLYEITYGDPVPIIHNI